MKQTEGMTGRVEHHAHTVLRLVVGQTCAGCQGVVDCRVEIVDLNVEVQHLVLSGRLLRPGWFAVTGLGLERQSGATLRVAHQHPFRLARGDVPTEQSAVEIGHDVRVGAVDADGCESER